MLVFSVHSATNCSRNSPAVRSQSFRIANMTRIESQPTIFSQSCRCLPMTSMRVSCSLIICASLSVLLVFSTPAQVLDLDTINDVLNSQSPEKRTLALPTSVNTTHLIDLPNVACVGFYGSNLALASCQDALSKISHDFNPLTFGMRKTGVFDVPLPTRYLSSMLPLNSFSTHILIHIDVLQPLFDDHLMNLMDVSHASSTDDGSCAIDVSPGAIIRPDVATMQQIWLVASLTIDKCIIRQDVTTGGIGYTGAPIVHSHCSEKSHHLLTWRIFRCS